VRPAWGIAVWWPDRAESSPPRCRSTSILYASSDTGHAAVVASVGLDLVCFVGYWARGRRRERWSRLLRARHRCPLVPPRPGRSQTGSPSIGASQGAARLGKEQGGGAVREGVGRRPWGFFPFLPVIAAQDPSDGRWASAHLLDVPRSFSYLIVKIKINVTRLSTAS
jgi:hypothetical protein